MSKKFIHRKDFCQRGHSMAAADIRIDENGYEHRRCAICRKENLRRWRTENPDRVRAEAVSYAPNRLEKEWRFRMWENAHLRPEHKAAIMEMMLRNPHVTSLSELTCPVFVFELHGKKQREVLNEPLPRW